MALTATTTDPPIDLPTDSPTDQVAGAPAAGTAAIGARAPLAALPGHRAARTDAEVLEARLCVVAARMHAVEAELVSLLADFDDREAWAGVGIRSVGQWAAINLGIASRTAAAQATAGRRLRSLPAVGAAAAAGALGWDKVRLVTQVAEPASEAKWLGLAGEMSVTQLARVVGAYRRASESDHPDGHDNRRERRGIWLFDQPDGLVRVTGLLEADDAAVLRAALTAMEEHLHRARPDTEPPSPRERRHPGEHAGHATDPVGTPPATGTRPDDRAAGDAPTFAPEHDLGDDPLGGPPPGDNLLNDDRRSDDPLGNDPSGDRPVGARPAGGDGPPTLFPEPAQPSRTVRPPAPAGPPASRPTPPRDGMLGPPGPGRGDRARPATPDEVDPTRATRAPWAARRADALVALARQALTVGPAAGVDADHTEVVVVVDADVLAAGGHGPDVGRSHLLGGPALPTEAARRLACDARLRPLLTDPDGNPLHVGRSQRSVNKRLRRALWARDGGCAFPGCPVTTHVQAHHIRHWADRGETEVDNLVLLCRHHHRLHHEGGYRARMRDNRPEFHRPDGTRIAPPRLAGAADGDRPHDVAPRVTHHTPRARSGGTNQWSLAHTIDDLVTPAGAGRAGAACRARRTPRS